MQGVVDTLICFLWERNRDILRISVFRRADVYYLFVGESLIYSPLMYHVRTLCIRDIETHCISLGCWMDASGVPEGGRARHAAGGDARGLPSKGGADTGKSGGYWGEEGGRNGGGGGGSKTVLFFCRD